ncbi:MAG: IS630 family transposase, partial [Prevotella sp.]|nr:IS630 family transposase [Prevotella sp.]
MKNSVVVFQDEVHFMAQTTVTRSWAPVGSAPKIKSLPGRDKISFSGFVVPKTGQLFMDKPDRFNYETVIASIRSFLSAYEPGEGTRIFLIMDNAGWHKKAKRLIKENVDGKYDDINRFVTFVYMPPYSPDLNPIEQVWRKTRR